MLGETELFLDPGPGGNDADDEALNACEPPLTDLDRSMFAPWMSFDVANTSWAITADHTTGNLVVASLDFCDGQPAYEVPYDGLVDDVVRSILNFFSNFLNARSMEVRNGRLQTRGVALLVL